MSNEERLIMALCKALGFWVKVIPIETPGREVLYDYKVIKPNPDCKICKGKSYYEKDKVVIDCEECLDER